MAVNNMLVLAGEGGSSLMYVGDPTDALSSALKTLDFDDDLTTSPLSALKDAGWISEDGLTSGRDFTTENLPAYGTRSPIRVFNTEDTKTFTINMLETNPISVAVYELKKLADVVPTAGGVIETVTGEAAGGASYSLVFDVVDGTRGKGRIIVPQADVTAVTERNIRGGQAIIRGVTFTAKPVTIDGSVIAVRELWQLADLVTTP